MALQPRAEGLLEVAVLLGGLKQPHPAVGPVQDVADQPGLDGYGGSGHGLHATTFNIPCQQTQ